MEHEKTSEAELFKNLDEYSLRILGSLGLYDASKDEYKTRPPETKTYPHNQNVVLGED